MQNMQRILLYIRAATSYPNTYRTTVQLPNLFKKICNGSQLGNAVLFPYTDFLYNFCFYLTFRITETTLQNYAQRENV